LNKFAAFPVFLTPDIHRIDLLSEANDYLVGFASAAKKEIPNFNDVTGDLIIKGQVLNEYSHGQLFKKFVVECLAPEVDKTKLMTHANITNGFISIANVQQGVIPDYSLRDSLSQLNRLALYNRVTKVKMTGFDFEGIELKDKYATLTHFKYPLNCNFTNFQSIDNLQNFFFDEVTSIIFDNCRILFVENVPAVGNAPRVVRRNIISLRDLRICMGFEPYLRFLKAIMNSSAKDDFFNPHSIRVAFAEQIDQIMRRQIVTTFPVVALGDDYFDGIEQFQFLMTDTVVPNQFSRLEPREIDLPLIKATMARIDPTYQNNKLVKFIACLDIIRVVGPVLRTGHVYDLFFKMTTNEYKNELRSVAIVLSAQLSQLLTKNDVRSPAFNHVLERLGATNINGALQGVPSEIAILKEMYGVGNTDLNPKYSFNSIYSLLVGCDTVVRTSFIAMLFDSVLVAIAVGTYYSDVAERRFKFDKSNLFSLYVSQYLSPHEVDDVYGVNFDSLKACINYGVITVKNFPVKAIEMPPTEHPGILLIGSREITVNMALEQVFTLYGNRLLDQLEVYRNTDFFYRDSIPGSFKEKLKRWLDSYFPGFLKPPHVNPFDLVSQPFIERPVYQNTVFPTRNLVLPDLRTFPN
jgi:hypothetical protein